ncbi:MAG: hypothetical protein NW200_13615 [Hyphomonadaceae bacterium]|nr:hypothetical protein [Hyphomonadaceae bacterium]
MWIETDQYIGPCRRGGEKGFRLINRRRFRGGDRTPSIHALFRQLHANAMDLSDPLKRRRFKLRLAATIGVAQRARLHAVAAQLELLDRRMTETALADPRAATAIEQILSAALAALPQR